jgi:acyl-homoserine lactone acylase PvdQ
MKRFIELLTFVSLTLTVSYAFGQPFSKSEILRYEHEAKGVTIIRDDWGVPHIYSKTDAGAVFGLMYAQSEENFKGIERNYLYQLGKQSEVDGESSLYTDLQLQLIADSTDAISDYKNSPFWFKKIMDAFADGINYYLYKHPEVKPLIFKRFKPWFALMFTDGSVAATETGGIALEETSMFYGGQKEKGFSKLQHLPGPFTEVIHEKETGSNGFALAPRLTADGHALLYINPHVPFYFRSEVQMVSDEGLNVYGAVTWGQFFVYQGFNQHCGWMHTSSYADVADLYAEKVVQKNGRWFYTYEGKLKAVTVRQLTLDVKKNGITERKTITGYYTLHGPVLGQRDGRWLALKANNRSYKALLESWLITKANNFKQYKKAMNLLSNATNNTVYADDKGNIAFWYGNFMPKRNPETDWTLPVDGTTAANEWQGVHPLNEIVHIYNPATGWIQNCNSTPYTSSGASSPQKARYPPYMSPDGQNYRGIQAASLLGSAKKMTLEKLIVLGYNHYLAAFDVLLPALFKAYDDAPDTLKQQLKEPIEVLRKWDKNAADTSVATTLAVEWGTRMFQQLPPARTMEAATYQTDRVTTMLQKINDQTVLKNLTETIVSLRNRFGEWEMPWGKINRYQRPADGMTFRDDEPSLPVGLTGSQFGQLPSFQSKTMGTQKRYGYSGNSFISAVEFGSKIKAKSLITGGQYFGPESGHFTDQAEMYIKGKFKDVLFYKKDVIGHAEKTYHPGDEMK